MDAKELRIGNFISLSGYKDKYIKVSSIWCEQTNGWMVNELPIFSFEPISLNTELLAKCGFEIQSSSHKSANYKHYCSIGFIDVKFTDTKYVVYHCVAGVKVVMDNVKYLHQIQNLHYAFTGEDLQIEL